METIETTPQATPDAEIKAHLFEKIYAYIVLTDNEMRFDSPVYAINWFNTRLSWVYNFYNFLANVSVKKFGGAAFFKGYLKKPIYGVPEDCRNVLLIVKYPSLQNFKTMLQSRYFQIVSLIRIFAVRDFTFGFTRRLNDSVAFPPSIESGVYAVHHFTGKSGIIEKIEKLVVESDVEIFYAGIIGALVHTGTIEAKSEQTPCLMDSIVVFRADQDAELEQFLSTKPYQAIIAQTRSSFIGLFDRVL